MKTIYKKPEDEILQASQDFNDVPVQQPAAQVPAQPAATLQQPAADPGVLKTAQPIAKAQTAPAFDMTKWNATKPTYASDYAERIDALLDEVLNRPDFSYDPESDVMYQQMQKQYRREGTRAMNDAMADLAVSAGGMNSYAMSAAQQAHNYQMAQLGDRLPELARLAYEMYLQDYNQDVQNLGLLRQQEADQYGRYQDDLNDWYAQLQTAYNQHRDTVADSQWQQSFDYQAQQDALAYQQWLEEMERLKAQDELAQQNWLAEMARLKEQDALKQQNWQKEFDHTVDQDKIANDYRQDVFDHDVGQDNIANVKDVVEMKKEGFTDEELADLLALVTPSDPVTGGGTPAVQPVAPTPEVKPTPAVKPAPAPVAPKRDTDGRTYDNGTLTRDQVMMLQELYDVENVDGLWGRESTEKAGMTAEEAWDYYHAVNGYDEEPELTTANRHGDDWVLVNGYSGRMTWVELENKVNSGEIEEEIDRKTGTVTYRKAN